MAKNGVPFMLLWAIVFAVFTRALAARDGDGGADVVFCGNPGAGKSTLLSSISGLHFESGVSWGSGLTNRLEMKASPSLPGVRFSDTPGLADVTMAKQVAAAITQALKDAAQSRRTLMLFFVVTVEAGRIRDNDLYTIKQVMGSIVMPDGSVPGRNSYGVIINKCNLLERPDFETRGKSILMTILGLKSESVPFTTSYVRFLPLVPDISAADNQPVVFQGLTDFVLGFPGLESIAEAREIDVSSMQEKLDELAKTYNQEMARMEQALKEGHQEQLAAMQHQMEANMRDMEAKLREAEEKASNHSKKDHQPSEVDDKYTGPWTWENIGWEVFRGLALPAASYYFYPTPAMPPNCVALPGSGSIPACIR